MLKVPITTLPSLSVFNNKNVIDNSFAFALLFDKISSTDTLRLGILQLFDDIAIRTFTPTILPSNVPLAILLYPYLLASHLHLHPYTPRAAPRAVLGWSNQARFLVTYYQHVHRISGIVLFTLHPVQSLPVKGSRYQIPGGLIVLRQIAVTQFLL